MSTDTFVLCLLACAALTACQTMPTPSRGEVQVLSDIELNGPMPEAFRELVVVVEPYAALYVTETGGGGGRIGGQSSFEAAKSGALAQCEEINPDRTRTLYATKTP